MDHTKQGRTDIRRIAYIGGAICLSVVISFVAAAVITMGVHLLQAEVSRPTLRLALFIGWLIVTFALYLYAQSLCFIPIISIALGAFSPSMQQRYGQFMRRTIGKWRPYHALCRAL